MKLLKLGILPSLFLMLSAMTLLAGPSSRGGGVKTDGVPVKMTVTASVDKGRNMPEITQEDVFVKSGKETLQVLEWSAARGERAGLELFILMDDASTSSLGSQLKDLRSFILSLPSTASVGVGYARNGTVEIRQNFTTDHELASKALRLPVSSAGAFGSPYLSVVDLMKRWPETANRREVLLVTDGIDRAGRGRNAMLNPDVDTAATVAQKTGTMVHTMYFPGAGHHFRNWFVAVSGQNAMAKLSNFTGGECYFLGTQNPVSFAPYLDELRNVLGNQYLLTLSVKPAKKAVFQTVTVGTEVAGVDFNGPDAVWVPPSR